MSDEFPNDAAFLAAYTPDALIVTKEGGTPVSLGRALIIEAALCEVDDSRRLDPARRARFMAQSLLRGGVTLRAEHAQLVELKFEDD